MWFFERHVRSGQSHPMRSAPSPRLPRTEVVLLSGEASVQLPADLQAVVLGLRGSCAVSNGDGQLEISGRRWMVCEPESRVQVLGGEDALFLVLGFTPAAMKTLTAKGKRALLPGQGQLTRECAQFLAAALRGAGEATTDFAQREPLLRSLFRRLLNLQGDLLRLLTVCPGKSPSQSRRSGPG